MTKVCLAEWTQLLLTSNQRSRREPSRCLWVESDLVLDMKRVIQVPYLYERVLSKNMFVSPICIQVQQSYPRYPTNSIGYIALHYNRFRTLKKNNNKTFLSFIFIYLFSDQIRSVAQSCPTLCDPWITARQDSLPITNSWSSLKLTSIESVMPSSHLILCHPLLLLPSIPPSISLFQWVNSSHEEAKVLEFQL